MESYNIKNELSKVAINVFITNLYPNLRKAATNNGTFKRNTERPIGKPKR